MFIYKYDQKGPNLLPLAQKSLILEDLKWRWETSDVI